MKLDNLVKSKYFCYFTYALMVINLLGYVSTGAMECVVVFALATFACKSCLSKNMCLCIFGGLFVSNILFGCSKVKEGFEVAGKSKAECKADRTSKKEKKEQAKAVLDDEKKQAKADLDEEIKKLAEELENCEDAADYVAAAAAATSGDAVSDGDGEDTDEGFRNRRNRRRAVREAFSTIHRAVRSY